MAKTKFTLLFMLTVLLANIVVLAEEKTTPKSIIGATAGMHFRKINYNAGLGGDMFYRHHISSTDRYYQYLSGNIGYAQYENKHNNIIRKDIPITLGITVYSSDFFYYTLEFGALNRKEEETFNESIPNTTSNETKIVYRMGLGFSIPISKSLGIDVSYQGFYFFDSEKRSEKLGISFSYRF